MRRARTAAGAKLLMPKRAKAPSRYSAWVVGAQSVSGMEGVGRVDEEDVDAGGAEAGERGVRFGVEGGEGRGGKAAWVSWSRGRILAWTRHLGRHDSQVGFVGAVELGGVDGGEGG